jgi:hypothetical protein
MYLARRTPVVTLPMDGYSASEADYTTSQNLLREINAEEKRSGARPTHITAPATWLPGYAEWYSWRLVRDDTVTEPTAFYEES